MEGMLEHIIKLHPYQCNVDNMATRVVFLIQLKLFVQMHTQTLATDIPLPHLNYAAHGFPPLFLSPVHILLHKPHLHFSGLEETAGERLRTYSLTAKKILVRKGGLCPIFFLDSDQPWPWPVINLGHTPKTGLTFQQNYGYDFFFCWLLHGTTAFKPFLEVGRWAKPTGPNSKFYSGVFCP
jgi:hypothetical protein